MSIFTKIWTAIRGAANEAGEAIIDANGIRIMEQEMRDAETALAKAKQDLTTVMAKEMQAAREIARLDREIKKHEEFAQQALDKNNEELALELANKIAELNNEHTTQLKAHESFKNHVERLKAMIKKTSKGLTDMQRNLVMIKTTENVQKATTAITENFASGTSKLLTAKETMERIKAKQEDLEDRLKAGEMLQDEFSGSDLETKLKQAGIGDTSESAQEILAKLKAKKSA
jgi:phage shock protein A